MVQCTISTCMYKLVQCTSMYYCTLNTRAVHHVVNGPHIAFGLIFFILLYLAPIKCGPLTSILGLGHYTRPLDSSAVLYTVYNVHSVHCTHIQYKSIYCTFFYILYLVLKNTYVDYLYEIGEVVD